MAIAVKAENISKAYQLGQIGAGTLQSDFRRWYARARGKEDPFLKIGETNDRTVKGSSDVVWSLRDINFEIEQGDAVGIIGPNGAGKSTLLKILSRVTAPTTGKITGNGRVASLLEVGTGFHPELTGRENIYLNGAILGMRKKEITRKFDEIVDFAGVERYIDTPVKRYSSGMYVRLAFAVAAHLESEILIVDEVLAVGDAEFQKKCLGKMGEVSKGDGRTVLFVSHNMASVAALCQACIVLKNGSVALKGKTELGIAHYTSLQTNKNNVYCGEGIIKNIRLIANPFLTYNSELLIQVCFSASIPITNLVVGIAIKDSLNVPVIAVNNRHYSREKINKASVEQGVLEIQFKHIQLLPGGYFIDFFIGDAMIDLEVIENAIYFEIQETLINPTDHQINFRLNKVFIDKVNWVLRNEK